MKSHRLARVSEVVRETAANAILFELKDPRVKGVTVTRAEVSADLQPAKIFVSIMGTEKEQQLTMHGLKSAAGFIPTKLADRPTSRSIPHVTFALDEGAKNSIEIARLLRQEDDRLAAARAETPDAPNATDEADENAPDEPDTTAEGPTDRPSN